MPPPPKLLAGWRIDRSSSIEFRSRIGNLGDVPYTMSKPKIDTTEMGLSAICLVIRAKEGPRFVFHYPAHPSNKPIRREARYGTELDTEFVELGDDDECESDDSDFDQGAFSFGLENLNFSENEKGDHAEVQGDEHYTNEKGEHVAPWEHLFEFPTADLESILTPSREFNRKKFELSLDPLRLVTYPMHVREDGFWKKRPKKKVNKAKKDGEDGSGSGEKKGTSTEGADEVSGMTMFNVVFILNLRKEEEDDKIQEIYEHIIKKFNKALNHAQASSDYVWKESEMILAMKEKAREERRPMSWLWNEILGKSSLAASISDVFNAVCNNKIATVHLASKPPVDLSLQIPIPSFLASFPDSREKAMLGLLLTSANPMIDEEGNENPTFLNKHYALLLLDNEEKIRAEIHNDNTELTPALLELIRVCDPTMSFLQVAQASSIELSSLLVLAQHLIYWRRAIAIPPLHSREMYIVSPNCDSRKLPSASVAWKKAFPLAPSFPSYLAQLSAAPRPYKTFSPSKDHRPTYLNMLAWSIRGGWVTQLHTFAWIIVWPEIIYEVRYQIKSDAVAKAQNRANASDPSTSTDSTSDSAPEKPLHRSEMTTEQAAEDARLSRLAQKTLEETTAFATEFAKLPVPVPTTHPSVNNSAHFRSQKLEPYIIKDPHKVSHEESLYIAAYGKRFTDPKIRECWFKFCAKYFNGKQALEGICLQEGMKRKETWAILLQFQEIILVTKHW